METTQSSQRGNGSRRKSGLAQRLKDDSKAKMETGKRSAAQQIDQIADAIDAAGLQLDRDQPTIASYANRLANGAGKLANRLRESSIEELGSDVRATATRNPALFLLGGIALGAILARVMRMSDSRSGSSAAAPGDQDDQPARTSNATTYDAASGSATAEETTVDVHGYDEDVSSPSGRTGTSASDPSSSRSDL